MWSKSAQQALLFLVFFCISTSIFVSLERAQRTEYARGGNSISRRGLTIEDEACTRQSVTPWTYAQLTELESRVLKGLPRRTRSSRHARLALDPKNLWRMNANLDLELGLQLMGYTRVILADVPKELVEATGFRDIRPLLRSFQLLLDKETALVLCVGGQKESLRLPDYVSENVFQFSYIPWRPQDPQAQLGPAAKTVQRLLVYQAAVVLSGFKGSVMVVDALDTVLQADPFTHYEDRLAKEGLGFFAEQSTVRDDTEGVMRSLGHCATMVLGQEKGDGVAEHLGFMPSVSPVYMGAAKDMLDWWGLFARSLLDTPCNEEGMLHFLVLTGAAARGDTPLRFWIEPAARSRVLSCRAVSGGLHGGPSHGCGLYSISKTNAVLSMVKSTSESEGLLFTVLHGWPLRQDLQDALLVYKKRRA